MNPEPVLTFMSSLDPALVEEADLALPAKRRLPRAARAGLIAACLCLALIGTAAAGVVTGWIKTTGVTTSHVRRGDGEIISIAEVGIVVDGRAYIPWESFSQEARDFSSSALGLPKYKGFDSWDELEEFLGLNIFDNPVLDQAEPVTQENTSSLGGRRLEGNCFAGFHGLTEAPETVQMEAAYRLKDDGGEIYEVFLDGFVYTHPRDRDEQPMGYGIRGVWTEEKDLTPVTETYTAPSGRQAVITMFDDGTPLCIVTFQLNNVNYRLHICSLSANFLRPNSPGADELISIAKQILDAYS